MEREEICTRENVIKRLQELGANPEFLKMPAVIERIVNDGVKLSYIEVDVNGNISYTARSSFPKIERTFELQPDGTVKSGKIGKIDKYGMEVETGYEERSGIRRGEKIDIITAIDIADSYTTTYDNYPGWNIQEVQTALKENNILLIGDTIAKYPETENWYVDNGFLSPEKEIRDKEIAEAIQAAKVNYEALLEQQKEQLELEKNNHRDARLDAMDAARGGTLEHMFSIGRPSQEERVQGTLLNIEIIKKEIEEYGKLIETYLQGERPAEDISYTEEQAIQNRIEFFTKQAEIYSSKAQEMKEENEAKAEKIAKLQELAKRCSRIPFVGKKVLQTYNEQMLLLQEGKPTREESKEDEDIDTELTEAYKSYMTAYMEHKEAQDTSNKYSEAFKNLKSCILELGKVPFIGKRILREMEEMSEEKNNDAEQREEDEER